MRDYKNGANTLREWVTIVQFKLEIREEELKKLKEQYLKVKGELNELRQKLEKWQDHISRFDVQMNTKIVELDIEQEEF